MRKETTKAQQRELKEREEKRKILEEQAKTLKTEVEKATRKLKQTQAKLVQSEKMNSLAKMAAGLAHEINNSINISNTNLNILERDFKYLENYVQKFETINLEIKDIKNKLKEIKSYGKDLDVAELFEEITESINKAKNGLDRTVQITQGLKDFSKVDSKGLVFTDINADIQTVINIQQPSIGEVQIKTDFGDIPTVLCNSQKLIDCYQILLENSILAIKEKDIPEKEGLIKIETRDKKDNIIISFTDNGIGINKEIQKEIFDPFFTTRSIGNKGLGLSIALGSIEEHNGSIKVKSRPGEGSTFILIFPIEINK